MHIFQEVMSHMEKTNPCMSNTYIIKSTKVQTSPIMRAVCQPFSKADMAENRCAAGAKGYKQLCNVIGYTLLLSYSIYSPPPLSLLMRSWR